MTLFMDKLMADNLVMRSVYLSVGDDARLRQRASEANLTPSALIQSAVRIKLSEWFESPETLKRDLAIQVSERC